MPKNEPREAGAAPPPPPYLAPHSHCVVCGRAVAAGETFCSATCSQTLEAQRRRQRRTSYTFLGFLAILMLVWFFVLSRPSS
ncbi:MAG: DUF2116 family Zn-ribbon domain-containing protein [Chloroflexota bacterium]